jgi:hypothetical protein
VHGDVDDAAAAGRELEHAVTVDERTAIETVNAWLDERYTAGVFTRSQAARYLGLAERLRGDSFAQRPVSDVKPSAIAACVRRLASDPTESMVFHDLLWAALGPVIRRH